MAWEAGNALGVFLVGKLIQSIISNNDPSYTFPAWHATLLVIGAVGIAFVGNVLGSRILPHWQNAVFVVHFIAYFAFIIPIWVNAPRASSKEVWTDFAGAGGWLSLSLSVMIGQLSGIYTQVGVDTVCSNSCSLARSPRMNKASSLQDCTFFVVPRDINPITPS